MLAFDFQEAAETRFGHIDVFELDLDLVHLLVGLLLAAEFAEGAEEGRGEKWDHLEGGRLATARLE